MRIGQKLTIAALAAVLGGLIVPALAEAPSGMERTPDQSAGSGMDQGMTSGGMMSRGMMGHGMMSGGMMGGGCSEMMQSMNNGGNGRPNSRWQKHPPGGATPD